MKKLIVLLASLLMFICGAVHAEMFADTYQAPCFQRIRSYSMYDLLKENFLSEESTFVRYGKQNKVTDVERELIPKYVEDIDNCRISTKYATDEFVDPVQANVATEMFNAFVELSLRLYNREIAYGEYFKLLDKEHSDHARQLAQRQNNISTDGRQLTQREAEQGEGFTKTPAYQQGMEQIQRALIPPTQQTTTCSALGNVVRCNTR